MELEKIGSLAFVVGLVIAVIFGLRGPAAGLTMVTLAVLGLIVGLLNVTHKESQIYLVAAIAFMISASSLTSITSAVGGVTENIKTFVAPGAAIVALRALYDLARGR